jgi:hypothetical protein
MAVLKDSIYSNFIYNESYRRDHLESSGSYLQGVWLLMVREVTWWSGANSAFLKNGLQNASSAL